MFPIREMSSRPTLETVYETLMAWCRADEYRGYDPFDGLNSRLFQQMPARHFRLARFGWIQVIKRCPIDLRQVLQVPKTINPKAIALFALAELSADRGRDPTDLVRMLKSLSFSVGEGKAAYGYNFDWQSSVFYAPLGTPTIVPTAFAARALTENFVRNGSEENLDLARQLCRFVVEDLNRPFDTESEVCFSYTPLDNSMIYNASLLAAETLATVGKIDGCERYLDLAKRGARFVIERQEPNGAWRYGPSSQHKWIDSFHTAFVLSSLNRILNAVPEMESAERAIKKGIGYWIDSLFLSDGTPKYFAERTYPVDIHSAGTAIATLAELNAYDERALPLAGRVADWTIQNMRDPAGFFYYQKRRMMTVKTPFMRWGQAWMAYGLAKLIAAAG